jgi:transcriptional regulator with XRE-family HTH domain
MFLDGNGVKFYVGHMQLQTWRKRKKWSLRQMAAELSNIVRRDEKCSASVVLRWERGDSAPSLPYVAAIMEVTQGEVTVADLVRTSERG